VAADLDLVLGGIVEIDRSRAPVRTPARDRAVEYLHVVAVQVIDDPGEVVLANDEAEVVEVARSRRGLLRREEVDDRVPIDAHGRKADLPRAEFVQPLDLEADQLPLRRYRAVEVVDV